MTERDQRRRQHLLIFLTVLIDLIGFGILIPILQPFGQKFGAGDWQLTLLMGTYSFMQFLFAPVLGRISDRVGRRPVILASLVGSTLGYLLIAYAGRAPFSPGVCLALVFLARIVTGICGASFATAQAYLADITAPEKRAAIMGMIGAAFGLGFMIGPVLGGLASRWGDDAPFLVAAGLSLLNFLLAWRRLPETLTPEMRGRAPSAVRPSLVHALRAARGTPFARLLAGNFIVITAFSMMTTCFVLFTDHRYGFGGHHNGLLFGFIGLIGVIVQGGMIRPLVARFRERNLAVTGIVLMATSLFLLPGTDPWAGLLLVTGLLAVGNSLTTPTMNGMASLCGTARDQGSTLGAMASAGSLGRCAGPLLAGPLLYVDPGHYGRAAMWTSAALMLAALVIVAGIRVLHGPQTSSATAA